jgi:hypothetical protein
MAVDTRIITQARIASVTMTFNASTSVNAFFFARAIRIPSFCRRVLSRVNITVKNGEKKEGA